MPSHLFQFKSALLTYSQVSDESAACFLSPASGHFELCALAFGTPNVYRLGREFHQDGGTHFHCFVSWPKRVSFRNERALDFASSHPNIKPIPRSPWLAFDYAGKDDDIIHEHGERPREPRAVSNGRDGVFGDALSAETKDDFHERLRSGAPRDYVLYFGAISDFADRHFATPPAPYTSPRFTGNGLHRVYDWFEQSGIRGERGGGRVKSLALWGPSRTGKTLWARSLGTFCGLGETPRPPGIYWRSPCGGLTSICWLATIRCGSPCLPAGTPPQLIDHQEC